MEGTIALTITELLSNAASIATGVVGMVQTWIGMFTANPALLFSLFAAPAMLALKVICRQK